MKFEAFAHGRVNLMGCGDLILSMATPQKLSLRLERRPDAIISVEGESDVGQTGNGKWSDLIRATSAVLTREGHRIHGFDLKVQSTIPIQMGLGSSSALTVALIKVLRAAYELRLNDVDAATLSQKIETELHGARATIADHMTSALVRPGEALFLNAGDLQFERVSIPLEVLEMAVIDSGLAVAEAESVLAERQREFIEAERLLEIGSLRALANAPGQWAERLKILPSPLQARVRHLISENARVQEAVQAFRARETKILGQIFSISQKSMAEDFEISTPEIDALIRLCKEEPDVFGARMTGNGKNRAVVILTKPRRAAEVADNVLRAYQAKFPASTPTRLL